MGPCWASTPCHRKLSAGKSSMQRPGFMNTQSYMSLYSQGMCKAKGVTCTWLVNYIYTYIYVSTPKLLSVKTLCQPSPSCLVVRPFVVALPTVWSFVCPGAAPCAYSCSAHVRPCMQGRCGRCPLGFGVMSVLYIFRERERGIYIYVPFFNFFLWSSQLLGKQSHSGIVTTERTTGSEGVAAMILRHYAMMPRHVETMVVVGSNRGRDTRGGLSQLRLLSSIQGGFRDASKARSTQRSD